VSALKKRLQKNGTDDKPSGPQGKAAPVKAKHATMFSGFADDDDDGEVQEERVREEEDKELEEDAEAMPAPAPKEAPSIPSRRAANTQGQPAVKANKGKSQQAQNNGKSGGKKKGNVGTSVEATSRSISRLPKWCTATTAVSACVAVLILVQVVLLVRGS